MSLLDDLARNSCRVDYSMQELVPEQMIESVLSESSSRSECSSPTKNYTLVANNIISPTKRGYLSIGKELYSSQHNEKSGYQKDFRNKLTKIQSMVGVLSAKTRKYSYQFIIHLERWCKDHRKQEEERKNITKKEESSQEQKHGGKWSEAIVYAKIEEMIKIMNTGLKDRLRTGMGGLKRKVRTVFKAEFLAKVIENIYLASQQQRQREFINFLCHISKTHVKNNTPSTCCKPLIIPCFKNTPVIKISLCQHPLNLKIENDLPFIKLKSIFPQKTQQQNKDFCDNMTLFLNQDERILLTSSSLMEESSSFNPSCVSANVESSKNSATPKSYIKMLSEMQFTAVPQSIIERRKISDFVGSAQERGLQNFSQIKEKDHHESCMSPTRSEANCYKQQISPVMVGKIEEEIQIDQLKEYHDLRKYLNDGSGVNQRRLSIAEPISRSKSQNQVFKTQRRSLSNAKGGIQKEYDEEMNRYLRFKKTLQERRDLTLKEIEKSQEMIKKLMVKFKKQKQKNVKLRVTLKPEKSRDSSIRGSVKKADYKQKKNFQSKTTPMKQRSNTDFKAKISLKKDRKECEFIIKQTDGIKIEENYNSPKNIDIYCQYMTGKKIMNSEKSTPKRKRSNHKTSDHGSYLKGEKRNQGVINQKNLMVISNFPVGKDHRVDLKVNLEKQSAKKVVPNSRYKQKGKRESCQIQKYKQKPCKK